LYLAFFSLGEKEPFTFSIECDFLRCCASPSAI